ncbi:succinate--CoA ligase [GDP-forming] subunit beta, mitochondrial-like [Vespa mandarinia]|uniref:succinate--CoA ligase [GDP-forming] subunit beta, mitochondrial-like n=1 Tax=Vespa mandarinia TaxID=7446 RepID=UPI00162000A9|nr:succinate--CoA ligase [GDP-forming] subunit beta, mitochondrial-like [Vespa mandarinia]XP_046822955.1 succinate--CoA ligase [GDP-forming] subunit beta, mitochondrial [Vespa crabro]XP_047355901.1 succinate--CoA ligase [GDP-forming] subunit beta, mitochondrial isoform X2 [Vespa velutina]
MLRILSLKSFQTPQIFIKNRLCEVIQFRKLNLLEYQSKELLRDCGISVQNFAIIDDLNKASSALKNLYANEYVIKAQVLAGGRGKGWFNNGFKGGVHLTKDPKEVVDVAKNMLGHRLITKQTSKDGILVQKVMIAESVDIVSEKYICILMDRQHNGPVIIASPLGGMDIEAIAKEQPELIKTVPLDIYNGINDAIAKDISNFLGFSDPEVHKKAIYELKSLWKLFVDIDALQIEINPLVLTKDKQVVAVDAKISFDDNAQFRQQELFALEDTNEKDPREVDALHFNLNYIGMDGNIGCLVNGAGLAMATMDIIQLNGGNPANFLDVGGNVKEDQVYQAFRILNEDPKVKAILVNVFGGIVNCTTIANGIIAAARNLGLKIPLVVRLEGTNVNEAKKTLRDSGLPIITANDLDEAARKAVMSIKT